MKTGNKKNPAIKADNLAKYLFEVIVLLSVFTLLLTPLNQIGHPYQTVIKTEYQANKKWIYFKKTWMHTVSIGEQLTFYRFNPEFQKPIGKVEVVELKNGIYRAKILASTFIFPPGNQGSVIENSGDSIKVNLGIDHGLAKNQRINLYDGQQRVATAELIDVSQNSASARIINYLNNYKAGSLAGLQVNTYIFPNGVYLNNNPLIRLFQWATLFTVFTVWLSTLFPAGKHIWPTITRITHHTLKIASERYKRIFLFLLGLPLCYIVGELTWNVFCHLNWAYNYYYLSARVEHYPEFGIWPMRIFFALIFYCRLIYNKQNPIHELWQHLSYRPQHFFGCPQTFKPYLIWGLHLFVFWAFASTLGSIVVGNLRAIINIAWGDFSTQSTTVSLFLFGWIKPFFPEVINKSMWVDHIYEMIKHMINYPPTNSMDVQSSYALIRLSIWSVTVSVSLVLYSYTVASIIWSRQAIRNIDFTLTGWISTAICYGPLLGGALYQMLPSSVGNTPNYDIDGWMWLTLTLEALLNLLYMLSIFNMGRKFGVLVDKGVVRTGFYSVIRHPSYLLEALMFIMIANIALSGLLQYVAISAFLLKYWIRAEREDQFMTASNPEFSEYKKQTPWKFIPGIY